MTRPENFHALVERAMQIEGQAHMRAVVEKELLHYDILFALENDNLLEKLTFQGGTSLRLCYAAPRFSEDLDFVGGKNFVTADLLTMKTCVEKHIGERYGLTVTVKEPKDLSHKPEYQDIKIDKWQIKVVTAPERKDLPQQKIKIEVGNIPAYTREPRPMVENYEFLPNGYSDTLIMVESLDEIMADKLISLVNCQRYVRHRDIWDLRWLKQKGAKLNIEFVTAKINDYHIDDYLEKLEQMHERLEDIIHGQAFFDEISRFVPMKLQEKTIRQEKFKTYLANELKQLFQDTKKAL